MQRFGNVAVHTGDVLLKVSTGNVTHKIIQIGQKTGASSGGFSNIVHAAIYVGSVAGHSKAIAESVGSGLRFLEPNPNSHYSWHVWHLGGNQALRHLAADLAANLVEKAQTDNGFGSYSQGGATISAYKSGNVTKNPVSGTLAEDMMNDFTSPNGTNRSFFCSNFVVLAYSMAAQMLGLPVTSGINLNYKYTSPAEMQKYFSRNHSWLNAGVINGAY
ncbi:hypothetical protein LMG28688_03697 [Paraburkholderia caffeinitolerans]|uniref:Uncharacterized protein n=1 Tax=Paraburkholderia caffeinitolerans TaxID=1723730 RepID=A0A6J5G6W3_9BURK|nr:hypothetical protein [Paraburkholderia caffeinitolerans]CAB3793317.1 hypothetical protein LMG28688_03697 [Paraburkholderia caffeinitolerans]